MSTDFSSLSFDSGGNGLAVYIHDSVASINPIEVTEIQYQDEGVMVRTSGLLRFFPYSNIAEIRQSE